MSVELPSPKMTLVDHGEEFGVKWVTCKAPLYGAVNGYVKIPEGHHWYGLDYDDINVDVHGGLTFSNAAGWIGFDCLHSGDIWPGEPEKYRLPPSSWDKHWTPELVAMEARSLARAVAAAAYGAADLSGSVANIGGDE